MSIYESVGRMSMSLPLAQAASDQRLETSYTLFSTHYAAEDLIRA